MYLNHFGLDEAPFSITPDPRFVYLSERHRDGLAHLLYGVGQGGSGGFIQLTGEVGTGKTTLCRLLLEQLPEQTEVALLLNPRLNPVELVETLCQELKLDLDGARGSLMLLVERLNAHLLARHAEGWRVVALIDEAQDLSPEALEQVRLLTNLETAQQKLLQIILVGQPELRTLLERPDLRQLAQRVTARFHLTPLDVADTEEYVRHRLAVAGSSKPLFTRLALRTLHRHAAGVPRLLNVIADRALLAAYVAGTAQVGERAVAQAAREALHGELAVRRHGWLVLGLLALALVLASLWWSGRQRLGPAPPPAAVADSQPVPEPVLDGAGLARLVEQAAGEAPRTWASYLALWQQTDPEVLAAAQGCPAEVAPGLHCLRGSGSFGKLRAIDRPVLIKLSHGTLVLPALVRAIGRDRVRLELAGQTAVVSREALEAFWFGDYLALWRHPVGLALTLRSGGRADTLDYLVRRLQAAGEAVEPAPRYTGALRAAVRRVQQRHGLLADGVVGPETWLVLSKYDPAGPRLDAAEH